MINWQPTASLSVLQQRAVILAKIRQFFAERDVLEVETPLMCSSTVTDVHLHSITCQYHAPGEQLPTTYYLQTSPEFAMKRLLAAGYGSIYQICKAFRDEEAGRQHNPEFSMLEWYRVGFDHHDLMAEMDDFLRLILDCKPAEKISYQQLFQQHLAVNPHTASLAELYELAVSKQIVLSCDMQHADKDTYLQLLMSLLIEPHLGQHSRPVFIYDYPASQAALARLRSENDFTVAERFEVYYQGVELANGFHELADADEQRQRFQQDLDKRSKCGLPIVPIDENLLQALKFGLPDCAGVALGIDRLLMLACEANSIKDVLSFIAR